MGKLLFYVGWVMGFVFAKGFWSTFFCIIPLWAYYIVIEHFVIKYNLL
jgi:hypothetical protein